MLLLRGAAAALAARRLGGAARGLAAGERSRDRGDAHDGDDGGGGGGGGGGAWEGHVRQKVRGGAKAKQWSKFKQRSGDAAELPFGAAAAAKPPGGAAAASAAAAAPPPAPAPPPPPRVVLVADRVSVRELARALEVSLPRLEELMSELGDAPASEEECAPHGSLRTPHATEPPPRARLRLRQLRAAR
jgi:hypothetical protein